MIWRGQRCGKGVIKGKAFSRTTGAVRTLAPLFTRTACEPPDGRQYPQAAGALQWLASLQRQQTVRYVLVNLKDENFSSSMASSEIANDSAHISGRVARSRNATMA